MRKNIMRITDVVAALLIFSGVITAHASIPELQNSNKRAQHVTDGMLEKIAVEKGIIPKDRDEAFFKEGIEKKKTVVIWIMIDSNTRISIIDNMRQLNKKEGVVIKLPSEYYAAEITDDIYNSIVNGDVVQMELANIFKTVAVMEGDYDNGKNKVAVAREYMGEDGFEMYRQLYPEKYEKLIRK